ncbi:MAG: 6-bladed beta-propeller, partial [Tannerellaceae bacterium]
MKNIFLSAAASLCCCVSCTQTTNETVCTTIDLGASIGQTTDAIPLNDLFDITQVLPIETTDDFLLSSIRLVGNPEKTLVFNESDRFYFVDKTTGKLLSKIDRKGNGPEEYTNIRVASIDNNGNALLCDWNNRYMQYSPQGEFISTIKNDSISDIFHLADGNYAVSYHPSLESSPGIAVYDKDFVLQRQGLSNDKMMSDVLIFFNRMFENDGNCYFQDVPFNDTLFCVTSEKDVPFLVLSSGDYKTPLDLYETYDRYKKDGSSYIMDKGGQFAGDKLFVNFTYGGSMYYDVWDMKTSKLLYRSAIGKDGGTQGIPLQIEGTEVVVWP